MSHTFATMEVSAATYNEVREAFEKAGHDHVLEAARRSPEGALDMHGIALVPKPKNFARAAPPPACSVHETTVRLMVLEAKVQELSETLDSHGIYHS